MQAAPSAINSLWKLAFEKLIFSERWFEKCLVAMIKKEEEDLMVGSIFPFQLALLYISNHISGLSTAIQCSSTLFWCFGYILATKRFTGDPLMSKRPNFLGLFSYLLQSECDRHMA